MPSLTRRVARAAAVTAVVGGASILLSAPASAQPPLPAWEKCSDPVDGVTVCLTATPAPELGYSQLTASITADQGRRIAVGMVSVDGCSGECNPLAHGAGTDTDRIVSKPTGLGKGAGYYAANASWVDDRGNRHLGVTAS
jgi:hypothetical protein